ncbi:hypothetical protein [Bradyrhizobium sp. CCBAU 051011]|uniref:hypothetical protein n=1 Tax=Bradyrhizobium sp. CCBAU 051011 TaxID=858422 RepID=UPI0013798B54|nr:hypothetical protein [Bradyrhizobium sp. CCBAU 051011]
MCQKPDEIHIFTTMPAIGSDGIKIANQIFLKKLFLCAADSRRSLAKEKRRGFPRRFEVLRRCRD